MLSSAPSAKVLTDLPNEILFGIQAHLDSLEDLHALMLVNRQMHSFCAGTMDSPAFPLEKLKSEHLESWLEDEEDDEADASSRTQFTRRYCGVLGERGSGAVSPHKSIANSGIPHLITAVKGRRLAEWANSSDENREEMHAAVREGSHALYQLAIEVTGPLTFDDLRRRFYVITNVLEPFLELLKKHRILIDATESVWRTKLALEHYWECAELFRPGLFDRDEFSVKVFPRAMGKLDSLIKDWIFHCTVPKISLHCHKKFAKVQFVDLVDLHGDISVMVGMCWHEFSKALSCSGIPALKCIVSGGRNTNALYQGRQWVKTLIGFPWNPIPSKDLVWAKWPDYAED